MKTIVILQRGRNIKGIFAGYYWMYPCHVSGFERGLSRKTSREITTFVEQEKIAGI